MVGGISSGDPGGTALIPAAKAIGGVKAETPNLCNRS